LLSYLVRRILGVLPVFFFVCLIAFGIIALVPGDFYTPALLGFVMSGHSVSEAFEAVDALRVEAGIDKPWIVQFWIWFTGVITKGDFGVSLRFLFSPQVGLLWTLIIAGSSMVWAWILGIPAGILSARKRNTWIDHGISVLTYLGFSMPAYVWGALFFVFMATFINKNIIGPGIWGLVGYGLEGQPLTWYKVGSHILHLLPAWVIVGAPLFATVTRHTRNSISDTLSEQYITVARGKGLSERGVLLRHALRNALNPLISIFGLMIPGMLASMILLAPVLGYDTFGRFLLRATQGQQQQQLIAALLVYASFLLIGNLIADLLLMANDPRIRYN
jgi:peptide/nickel transport system permease protein